MNRLNREQMAARVAQDFDEHLGVFLQAESEFGAYYEQYRRRNRNDDQKVHARTSASEKTCVISR